MYVVDVPKIMEAAQEMVTDEVKFTITSDEKSATFAASLPDCGSEELRMKMHALCAVADLLLTKAYAKNEYMSECEDEDKHDRWDKSIA